MSADPGKDGAGQVHRWRAPSMAQSGEITSQDIFTSRIKPPTADDIAAWEKAGREEGYARGYADGEAAARAEYASLGGRLKQIIEAAGNSLHDFDEEAEQALLRLSVVLAQQLVRREVRIDPGELVPVVRDALELLPVTSRNIRIQLNPQDLPVVSAALGSGEDGGFQLLEDTSMSRGGCRLISDDSHIDATLESRLAALAAAALVGARHDDR